VADYDLDNLTPYDFELLARDLVQKEFDVRLESFTTGRDVGIDFRHAPAADDSLIVQCKHYARSGFARLLRDLSKNELPRVQALAPDRYVLVTSVSMTPDRKAAVRAALDPFIREDADVIGAEDIDNLLRLWPDVLRANVKLWLTSAEVLSAVLNNANYVRMRGFEEELVERMRLYVPNPSFDAAGEALEDGHVCIITGVPGVGKSMLADALVADYVSKGYEPVFVSANVEEAERIYEAKRPQIFYYDDFLGPTTEGERFEKNEDKRLFALLKQVRRTANKRFILTTRDYILELAAQEHERFGDLAREFPRVIVSVGAYTRLIRGKILYNHLYFSDLSHDALKSVVDEERYMALVSHRNYSPRLIEAVTTLARSEGRDDRTFADFLNHALDNPGRVWQHAFENQLNDVAQAIVLGLASLPPAVMVDDLELAVGELLPARGGGELTRRDFHNSLRVLDGNFVRINRVDGQAIVAFHNPSIRDFALLYLDENDDELRRIVNSAPFFDQLALVRQYATEGQTAIIGVEPREFPGIRTTIEENALAFVEALMRAFGSATCGVRFGFSSAGALQVTPYEEVSPEQRLTTVITQSLNGQLVPGRWGEWANARIDEFEERWRRGCGSKAEARRAFGAMQRATGFEEAAERLQPVVKEWILGQLYDSGDYSIAIEFGRGIDPLLTETEVAALVRGFEEWVGPHLDEYARQADSAGELEGELDSLIELARDYGVHLDNLADVGSVRERIDELAAEEYEPEDDDRSDRRSVSDGDEAELIVLFDSLLSED
jgi:hypothetical protein